MRIDVVSIFPEYLAPLRLSLAGKAQDAGLLDVHVHDLRDWTHDRHRTVDDTPYGGGAGMVMRPEPWGEALDALVAATAGRRRRAGRADARRRAVHPGGRRRARDRASTAGVRLRPLRGHRPAGRSTRPPTRMTVREVSLGDYVLNGGEVAALVVIEAVARLLPGFMGNPESLAEESHEDGLLEYPVYTKPAVWRGHDVPAGAAVRRPRRGSPPGATSRRVRRTADRRPDLLHPGRRSRRRRSGRPARPARPTPASCSTLQRACWVHRGAGQPRRWTSRRCARTSTTSGPGSTTWTTFVVRAGAAAGRRGAGPARTATAWDIGRLMVAPDLRGRGLGRWLLARDRGGGAAGRRPARRCSPARGSAANLRMYKKAGYRRRAGSSPTTPAWCAWASRLPALSRFLRSARRCGKLAPRIRCVPATRPAPGRGPAGHLPQGAFRTTQPTERPDPTTPVPWVTCGAHEETP